MKESSEPKYVELYEEAIKHDGAAGITDEIREMVSNNK